MAKRDEQKRKLELLERLSRQRAQITSQRSRLASQIVEKKEELKDKINVPKRIKENVRSSFSSNPTKWFLGSAVGGLIVSKLLFGRKKKQKTLGSKLSSGTNTVSRGILTSALLYFGKPLLKRALINKAKNYVIQRYLLKKQQQQIQMDQQQYKYQG